MAESASALSAPLTRLLDQLARDTPAALEFARSFFAGVLPADLVPLTPKQAVAILQAVDSARQSRPSGTVTVEVMASPIHARRTAVVVINDDMPFLLDSASAEMAARGLAVHHLYHPILGVTRDAKGRLQKTHGLARDHATVLRESTIFMEIDRLGARDRAALQEKLVEIFAAVRVCVTDWQAMREKLARAASDLMAQPPHIPLEALGETRAFLDWMADDHFTLLGYRKYTYAAETETPASTDGLGLLRDADYPVWRGADGFVAVSAELRAFLGTAEPLLITKANTQSLVHRRVHLDYVGVKSFDASGRTEAEHRFIGLFTSSAYAQSVRDIPLLRQKVQHVIAASRLDPKSHAGKALVHALEAFPRDELIQIDAGALVETALGLVSLEERPRPKLFVRRDQFERFVSVVVYLPRDLYRADVRERVATLLTTRYKARLSLYSAQLSDEGLARIHYILGTVPGDVPHVDVADLDTALEQLVRGWDDQLETALDAGNGLASAARLSLTYGKAFSAAYKNQFDGAAAAGDIARLAKLDGGHDRAVHFYRFDGDAPATVRLKIYSVGDIIALSDAVPVLEHLGLRVIEEAPYDLEGGKLGWVHDFVLEDASRQPINLDHVRERLEAALTGVLTGAMEDDPFNALILCNELSARDVAVLRALFRYMRQTGMAYGLDTVRGALLKYPKITQALIKYTESKFNPVHADTAYADKFAADIESDLKNVAALDEDRILRQYLAVLKAMVRTNLYAPGGAEAVAFKIRSKDVPGLPLPVPFMEIWVYSPRLEGIHLRGGKVARGGLRWTDRRDDFRTEILGLIKAQMVKNAVIVPVGAKGGFYPKNLPSPSDRDAWLAEGTECYRIYIRALLSVTDNIVDGKIVPPVDVVRYDDDDPYLVVAADKGTATFSDVANAISIAHGHWLGDAFASGGSQGYDHKAMAITAKGAWISVERHFREMGLNVATDPIRVIGIGDMSGDVFGNGLLRSEAVKLVVAFDHRHIFIDPDPDPETSFAERARLFALPRSSWVDYDAGLVSPGGGIFARSLKSISLTPQVQAMLGISAAELTPTDLISAILKMDADLLWLGGIGTYVKAAAESHAQAGDKTNDALRVDAEGMRVKVVGEGANLGLTQKGRIAFAMKGGRINTDFIDNSAGVDCSDNEVNIKILLNPVVQSGNLSETDRNALLVAMTAQVSDLVLRDNYLQTQALSIEEAHAPARLAAHARLIRTLEKAGGLNRAVEQLPGDSEIADRAKGGKGFTRPELAVLLAYAKMTLFDALVASSVPDAQVLHGDLVQYFPTQVQEKYEAEMARHRLHREIIATKLANAVVNRGGLTLAFDMAEATNSPLWRVCGAFVAVRELFDFRRVWRMIDACDYKIPAALQTELHIRAEKILRGQMVSLIGREPDGLDLDATILQLKAGTTRLMTGPLAVVALNHDWSDVQARGAPADIVQMLAGLDAADAVAPLANLAAVTKSEDAALYATYTDIGAALDLAWLSDALEAFTPADPWERLAAQTLSTELMQARLTQVQMLHGDAAAWLAANAAKRERITALLSELGAQPVLTLAMLTHAVAQARAVLRMN
jgi:glutamate dehydrogenase